MPADSSAPNALSGWRWLVLLPLALFARAWARTLRFEITPEDKRAFETRDRPVIMVLWHNRLFLSPEFYRLYRAPRPLYALVSASRDGAWLTAFLSLVGMRAVRGSSSNRGREAASALIEMVRLGHDAAITPDGPRGPCYDFKPGALLLGKVTGAPFVLVGAQFTSAWRLRSWDRFYLPRPFSRVRVRCELISDPGVDVPARLRAINPD